MDNHHHLLIDEQTWQASNDPAGADDIARTLFILKEAIDSGPGGVKEASETLSANIESIYLYTNAHRAALNLYLLSLTGQLKPADEPLQLISAAIKRGRAELNLTRQGRAKKKRQR